MKQALEVLRRIKNTSGTNDKIGILSQYKEQKMIKCILNVVYNPRISTKIAKKKLEKSLPSIESALNDEQFMEFISKECSGKDSDIQIAQAYLNTFEGEDKEIVKEIITQKLSIGMDYKNINKAFGYQFIEFYECMLATNLQKVLDKIGSTEVYATLKLDGSRALIVCCDGTRKAYSRNGLELEGYEDFLNHLELEDGYVYDGELLYADDTLLSAIRFRKTSEITRTKGEKNKDLLTYNIFDIIPIDEFNKGSSALTYKDRRKQLDTIKENKYQRVVKVLYKGSFNNTLFAMLDEVVDNGEEGLMLNTADGLYEVGKRSKNILKMKKFHDVDIYCIGIEEGTGKHKGKLGSISVDYQGYEVKVGSGFSDEQRSYYWEHQNEIVGKIVTIKYFEESENKEGEKALRFPIFTQIRDDKNEVSYD